MSKLTKVIPLNIYEPESALKIFQNTKKKSIITNIIKNPEIQPAKKQIKIKYNSINENTLQLKEYNIFYRSNIKFRQMKKNENNDLKTINNINKNDRNIKNKNDKNEKFFINRKLLEKFNKNIPNNLYDYLNPHEYKLYSKNNNLMKNYFKMKLKGTKKEKELKLKLDDSFELNKNSTLKKYNRYNTSNVFLSLKNNLKTKKNKKLKIGSSKYIKTLSNDEKKYKYKSTSNNKNKNIKKYQRLKTSKIFYKNNNNVENSSISSSSIESISDSNRNTEKNIKKKLLLKENNIPIINNILHYNTLSSKNINSAKNSILNRRPIKMIRYNQKVFNRNNNILIPFEEMKKIVFNSNCQKSIKNNIFTITENAPLKKLEKNKKTKIIKNIVNLNNDLNELKYYMISNKIEREKYKQKWEELEKKMNNREDNVMIVKDILFEKLNNSDNQNDYINYATNKNHYVNKLISSYVNFNEKKADGLLNKKFMGGLKKLNDFGMQDAHIRSIIGENNYLIKHRINKIEEVEVSKDRKNLGENMKKIRVMAKFINNRKEYMGLEYKN